MTPGKRFHVIQVTVFQRADIGGTYTTNRQLWKVHKYEYTTDQEELAGFDVYSRGSLFIFTQ